MLDVVVSSSAGTRGLDKESIQGGLASKARILNTLCGLLLVGASLTLYTFVEKPDLNYSDDK